MNSFGRVNGMVTEDTPRIATPAAFRLPLMEPQLASIYAMIEMEKVKQVITAHGVLYTRGGVLSNDMGSGKTAIVIGLIAHSPIPTCGPLYPMALPIDMMGKHNFRVCSRGVILQRYRKVYRPNIVFVGSTVVNQWDREVDKFCPSIRRFVINDIVTLRRFYHEVLYTRKLDEIDMIIVKNKTIQGRWTWDHGEPSDSMSESTTRSIWNVFAAICRNYCFARLFVDDFDNIGLPNIAGHINSLMMWLVSSTTKMVKSYRWYSPGSSFEDSVHNSSTAYHSIVSDKNLFNMFNVHVDKAFMHKNATVGVTCYFVYQFDNTMQKMAKLISFIPSERAAEIMEALNGDDYDRAARIAGIETASPSAIFQKLFQENCESMITANRVLDLIHSQYNQYLTESGWNSLQVMSHNPDPDDSFTKKDLRRGRVPLYRYPGLRDNIREESTKWTEVSKITSTALQRFRESITSDSCGVCSMPLTGNGNCILPCCYEMMHADCAARGCNFTLQVVEGSDKMVNIGYCPYDKTHRVQYEQLIYVGGDFDLGSLTTLPMELESKIEKIEKPGRDAPAPATNRTKYDALLDILYGRDPPEQTRVTLKVPGISVSTIELGLPMYRTRYAAMRRALEDAGYPPAAVRAIAKFISPDAVPRVPVFSNFEGGLAKLREVLDNECIAYTQLGGTSSQLDAQSNAFERGETTLILIHSIRYCSGRNFQMGTDMVHMHYIVEVGNVPSVFPQTVGRLVRNGRTCDARQHTLLFKTEHPTFLALYAR